MDVGLVLVSLVAAGAALAAGGTPAKKSGKAKAGAVAIYLLFIITMGLIFNCISEATEVIYPVETAGMPEMAGSGPPRPVQTEVYMGENQYFSEIEAVIVTTAGALFKLADLDRTGNPSGYALAHEPELRAAASAVREASVMTLSMEGVPESLEDAHNLFREAMLCLYRSMYYFGLGLDALALDRTVAAGALFEQATVEMNEGNAFLEQAIVRWGHH